MGGIGGSRVQSANPKDCGERYFRQESVDFFDTLKNRRILSYVGSFLISVYDFSFLKGSAGKMLFRPVFTVKRSKAYRR